MKVSYRLGAPQATQHLFGLDRSGGRAPTRRARNERRMFAVRNLSAILGDIEGCLGFIFIALFTVIVTFGSLLWILTQNFAGRAHLSAAQLVVLWIEWGAAAIVQYCSIEFMFIAFVEAQQPRPVYVAMRQRFRWNWLRIFVGVWWFANAVSMLAIGEALLWTWERDRFGDRNSWEDCGITFLVFLACSYAANTFLLLTLAATHRRKRTLSTIWRFRFVLDASLALLAVSADRYFHLSAGWR